MFLSFLVAAFGVAAVMKTYRILAGRLQEEGQDTKDAIKPEDPMHNNNNKLATCYCGGIIMIMILIPTITYAC